MVKAAPGGSAKEFEWKQGEAPKMHIKLAKVSQVIHLLRWSIIESAGEPVLRLFRTFDEKAPILPADS